MAETLNPSDAGSWLDFVTKFDNASATFTANYNGLMALGPYIQTKHPELLPQYEAMLQRGSEHAYTLQQLKYTRDTAAAWIAWLQQGAQNTFDWFKSTVGLQGVEQNGFGYVPVIVAIVGIAAASAALLVIASWIKDAYVFAQRTNALQDMERKYPGATPAQVSAAVNATLGAPGSNEFLGIPWTLLIWGAVAVFLGPPLLKMLEGRK